MSMNSGSLPSVRRELAQSWGPDFRRVRAIVCHLADGSWRSIADLVQAHAISHQSVKRVIGALEPWLETREGRVRVRPDAVGEVASVFECSGEAINSILDSYKVAASESLDALNSMTRIIDGFSHRVKQLDHVSASALTCLKRAVFLTRNYGLAESNILFLGDHDLTSIALAHFCPGIETTVVDVDEAVLDYISDLSRNNAWRVRPIFADLRLEMPRSLAGRFDLVFADPP